jgi:hypothetical protein
VFELFHYQNFIWLKERVTDAYKVKKCNSVFTNFIKLVQKFRSTNQPKPRAVMTLLCCPVLKYGTPADVYSDCTHHRKDGEIAANIRRSVLRSIYFTRITCRTNYQSHILHTHKMLNFVMRNEDKMHLS